MNVISQRSSTSARTTCISLRIVSVARKKEERCRGGAPKCWRKRTTIDAERGSQSGSAARAHSAAPVPATSTSAGFIGGGADHWPPNFNNAFFHPAPRPCCDGGEARQGVDGGGGGAEGKVPAPQEGPGGTCGRPSLRDREPVSVQACAKRAVDARMTLCCSYNGLSVGSSLCAARFSALARFVQLTCLRAGEGGSGGRCGQEEGPHRTGAPRGGQEGASGAGGAHRIPLYTNQCGALRSCRTPCGAHRNSDTTLCSTSDPHST